MQGRNNYDKDKSTGREAGSNLHKSILLSLQNFQAGPELAVPHLSSSYKRRRLAGWDIGVSGEGDGLHQTCQTRNVSELFPHCLQWGGRGFLVTGSLTPLGYIVLHWNAGKRESQLREDQSKGCPRQSCLDECVGSEPVGSRQLKAWKKGELLQQLHAVGRETEACSHTSFCSSANSITSFSFPTRIGQIQQLRQPG